MDTVKVGVGGAVAGILAGALVSVLFENGLETFQIIRAAILGIIFTFVVRAYNRFKAKEPNESKDLS